MLEIIAPKHAAKFLMRVSTKFLTHTNLFVVILSMWAGHSIHLMITINFQVQLLLKY